MTENTSISKKPPDPDLLNDIAIELGVNPSFVEKDWYAVQVIAAVSQYNNENIEPVFAGGTNLSKAYGLIKRFSEDIDFRAKFVQKPARREIRDYRAGLIEAINDLDGLNVVAESLKSRDGSRFFSFDIEYPKVFDANASLRANLKLEFKVLLPQVEPELRDVRSFVSVMSGNAAEAQIHCITPIETAADKFSALIWRVLDRDRSAEHDDPTMIRHLHDLCALSEIVYEQKDVFVRLAQKSFTEDLSRGEERITQGISEAAKSVLLILRSDVEYQREYTNFVSGMSYSMEEEQIHFDTALGEFARLIDLFS